MSMFYKKHAWTLIYLVILTMFTLYVALDTFVITRVYAVVPSETPSPLSLNNNYTDNITATPTPSQQQSRSARNSGNTRSGGAPSSTGSTVTSSFDAIGESKTYTDDNINITVTLVREYETNIYIADIQLSSAEYLKTAFANNAFGRNVTATTSSIASSNNAILAVNGDFYGAQTQGYVLRNGVLYRESAASNREDLVIWADGGMSVITEGETSAEDLAADGAKQVLSFGPGLVVDGNITVSTSDEVGRASASNPRTAIGLVDELHYVFIVSDGRMSESGGLSLYQLAEFMSRLGVTTGYNLDGGGSSTMVFNGEMVNNPTTSGNRITERSVSDIVYIGY
ncbi:exopolysaccharide biosynthesis protein [Clostridia bacterium]|nr:exopolysaccharide biosynthesis protein [Clostridia bacterium]